MYCKDCGSENRDDAKFCRVCGRSLNGQARDYQGPPKRRRVPAWLTLVILLAIVLIVGAVAHGRLTEGGYSAPPLMDEDGRYVIDERVLGEVEASTSDSVPTVGELASSLSQRGFDGAVITSGYDMDGAPLEEAALDASSSEKHPLYSVYYATPSGSAWVIYVCNGSFMASPLFLYDPSSPGYMIVEDDYVTSYSSIEGKFIRSVPSESELAVRKVDRIDAATLDGLDADGIEAL